MGAPNEIPAKPRLLVVEDDEALRAVLVRRLGAHFEVVPSGDGSGAAGLLVDQTFDAILSDINLPGMSGVDLLRLVRSYDLDVPVILMTGQPSIETAIAALELGALTYLQKPFSHEQLETTLLRAGKLALLARTKREAALAGLGGSPLAGDRAGLSASFNRALDTLAMAYQPLVDGRTQKTAGYEALMRTKEPSMPHPGAVIEAAERLGRLHDLGRRVRACAVEGFRPGDDDSLLFVNLHPSDLLDADLYDRAAPLTKIAPRVVLEITERAALDDLTETKHRAAELRGRGFKIAIDDLGAGYAGLTSFATFEPEVVKLDMTLIRDVEKNPVKRQIVASMTRLCRDLDMRVVAEGIETADELACVVGLGCDYLQGYYLGRPSPEIAASTQKW
ncbi:MAG: EAL domain-containing protein [Labilithrix sp.]|nr:EAL domain-containing protein [Labilithrix sp.]MCW5810945.1 EAL domain-containing protein [Labilithrix sp.]